MAPSSCLLDLLLCWEADNWELGLCFSEMTVSQAGPCLVLEKQLAPCSAAGFSNALSLSLAPHRNREMKLPPWKPSTTGNPSSKPEWTSTYPGSAWSTMQDWQDLWLVRMALDCPLPALPLALPSKFRGSRAPLLPIPLRDGLLPFLKILQRFLGLSDLCCCALWHFCTFWELAGLNKSLVSPVTSQTSSGL